MDGGGCGGDVGSGGVVGGLSLLGKLADVHGEYSRVTSGKDVSYSWKSKDEKKTHTLSRGMFREKQANG